jgi:DNA-binding MarR family transcriptional regulator
LINSLDRASTAPGELGDLLYQAYELLEQALHAALVAGGFGDVRPAHAPAFQALTTLGRPTVSSMAAAAGVTKQHMSQLVRELEDLGYLTRAAAPGDARTKVVSLTDRGVAAVRAAASATVSTEVRWRQELGPSAMDALVRALRRIADTDL